MDANTNDVKAGDKIPELILPPINRATLALFAGASGDYNPIHIDIDSAKASGMEDVFAHGMLSMAYLGRMLTGWRSNSALRRFSVRFVKITHVHDVITCRGTVAEVLEEEGERRARLEITAERQNGEITLSGEAVVALS